MVPKPSSSLGGSWVVHDTDEGNTSSADDSGVNEKQRAPRKQQQRSTLQSSSKSTKGQWSGYSNPQEGPELIMPSINEPKFPNTKQPTPARRSIHAIHNPPSTKKSQSVNSRLANNTRSHQEPKSPLLEHVTTAIWGTLDWLMDILSQSLKSLKRPISWVIAAYAFAGLLTLMQNLLFNSLSTAFTPICRIPGVSFLGLPICRYPFDASRPSLPAGSNLPEPEFDALMNVQTQFEEILSDTASRAGLPWDMKRSEISMRDLRTVVTFANLQSKNELLHEFDGFIETSKSAIWNLQRFNSHVGRGVDMVLSTARWTQRFLDDFTQKQGERGIVPAFVSDTLLAPFQPMRFAESKLLDQYIQHTYAVSGEIERLIEEAQDLLGLLQNLEDRLDTIHSISVRDKLTTQASKDEILSELYTIIGGNRKKIKQQNNKLRVLNEIIEYRKLAYAHVAAVVLKLQTMSTELEQLRSRVGSAAEMRDAGIKSVPLSVHIEAIKLGVERLESKREETRSIEAKYRQKTFDRADSVMLEGNKDRLPLVDGRV